SGGIGWSSAWAAPDIPASAAMPSKLCKCARRLCMGFSPFLVLNSLRLPHGGDSGRQNGSYTARSVIAPSAARLCEGRGTSPLASVVLFRSHREGTLLVAGRVVEDGKRWIAVFAQKM